MFGGDFMFELKSQFSPRGDQSQAIEALTNGIERGLRHQVLLGVTGSGNAYKPNKRVTANANYVLYAYWKLVDLPLVRCLLLTIAFPSDS